VFGPLRTRSLGSVALSKSLGPMGDLHIVVLERLCAKLLGLAEVHDLLLTRKVAPGLHALGHTEMFGGGNGKCFARYLWVFRVIFSQI
jgi:hypothetical protein